MRVVESDETFLAFFDFGHYNSRLWHDKEAALESKRSRLAWNLRSFLFLGDYDLKGESPLPTGYSWQNSGDENWYGLSASYNKLLAPYSSVDNLLALRRSQMEKLVAKLTLDLKNYRTELVRVNRGKERPFLSSAKWSQLNARGKDLGRMIKTWEQRIERLNKCLAENLIDASSYTAESIASVCAHFASLDTPQKVIERKKDLYTQGVINPLLEQIALIKERSDKALSTLDGQLEREKVVCDKFISSLWGCMRELSKSPIAEKRPLTPNDTTDILEHLDARHALVRTERGENGECSVFKIKTFDAPPRVEASVFTTRMRDIVDRTRKKYCRPRYEVEQELEAKKAELWDIDDNIDDSSDLMRFDD
jgi:hypothetical protein